MEHPFHPLTNDGAHLRLCTGQRCYRSGLMADILHCVERSIRVGVPTAPDEHGGKRWQTYLPLKNGLQYLEKTLASIYMSPKRYTAELRQSSTQDRHSLMNIP